MKVISDIKEFKKVGRIIKIYPLLDVVFVYKWPTLYHYKGMFGGWLLHKVVRKKSMIKAKKYANNWITCDGKD